MTAVQTVSWRNGPQGFSKRHLCERSKPFTTFCGAPIPENRWATIHRDKTPIENELCSSCLKRYAAMEGA